MTHDEAREILRQCRVTLLDDYIDQQEAAERERQNLRLELDGMLVAKHVERVEQARAEGYERGKAGLGKVIEVARELHALVRYEKPEGHRLENKARELVALLSGEG